jgi:flagellar biosynthesis/type III secretory pathway protein FliH
MSIIRGEKSSEIATLTAAKGLYFSEKNSHHHPFVEEECSRAFQRGVEKGEKIGYERALNETRGLLDLLQTLTQKLLEQKKRLLDRLKPEIIEFAMTLCERIIRKELSQPEAMVKLINALLNGCAPQFRNERVQIILAPEDLAMLEGHLTQIQYDKREITGIFFRADPLIKRGDCRIETQRGLLNYTISRELADLQAKVLQS